MQQGGRWLFFTAAPLRDADGHVSGAIETLQDITERKAAEEELTRIAAIKSEFTSVVSHELRIPLSAIKEGIGIVMDGSAGAVSNEQKEFLNTAKRNVDRLSRLINDVLDYQKLDAGKMDYDMKENDVNDLIQEVIATMRPLAEKKNLDFASDLARDLPKVHCDRDRITQVLNNLVNNAIKFTETGSILISTRKNGNSIVVCVKDTGVGIKPEDIDKLFQSFSQVLTGKDRKAGGTGLGLAISKKIIQQQGGRMWAESEFGKWTAFYFNLPIVDRRRA
jgi:signal transduction histidine kinase